jgi:uncharacterized protein (TIGR00369 family)
MRRLLTNTFGFASNCWVCEPSNPIGLHVPFHHDDEAGTVTATVRLDANHSGAPNLVHGGLLAALCDDAMAWASIAQARRFALTAETRLSYLAPVAVDQEVTVTARLIGQVGRQVWLLAEVRAGGTVCVRAESRATVVGGELALDAGVTTSEDGTVPETAPHTG